MRRVRGALFRDYVRMVRAVPSADAARVRAELDDEARGFLDARIDREGWYPMTAFERLGGAILTHVCRGELFPVQLWGRYSAQPLTTAYPIVVAGDVRASLAGFTRVREELFDFDAITVASASATEASIRVAYQMGMPAEAAASHQTMGFFEGLIALTGGKVVDAAFRRRSWADDGDTIIGLRWTP